MELARDVGRPVWVVRLGHGAVTALEGAAVRDLQIEADRRRQGLGGAVGADRLEVAARVLQLFKAHVVSVRLGKQEVP